MNHDYNHHHPSLAASLDQAALALASERQQLFDHPSKTTSALTLSAGRMHQQENLSLFIISFWKKMKTKVYLVFI
jgi:hypothetical protein